MFSNKIFLSLSFITLVFAKLAAQNQVIDIWNGKMPDAINKSNVHQVVDSSGGWIKMNNVTVPTLEMYLPQKNKINGTAVIICPGGAYSFLAIDHEGRKVAQWLNGLGITAFVLNYRLPNDSIMKDKTIAALQDVQQAMRVGRQNAKQWNIDPSKIGIMGFSAGGHVASSLAVHYNDSVYQTKDTTSARPDFSILIYAVITMDAATTNTWSRNNLLGKTPSEKLVKYFSNELQVNSHTPPAFLVHSLDDDAVPVVNSINYAIALQQNHVPCEVHLYQTGKHGYGMGRSTNTESTWTTACEKWLRMNSLLR